MTHVGDVEDRHGIWSGHVFFIFSTQDNNNTLKMYFIQIWTDYKLHVSEHECENESNN